MTNKQKYNTDFLNSKDNFNNLHDIDNISISSKLSNDSKKSVNSRLSLKSIKSINSKNSLKSKVSNTSKNSVKSKASNKTNNTYKTNNTANTFRSNYTYRTGGTAKSNYNKKKYKKKRYFSPEQISRYVKESIKNSFVVDKSKYKDLSTGEYICYFGIDDKFKNGGFIWKKGIKKERDYWIVGRQPGSHPRVFRYVLYWDKIKLLFKKIDYETSLLVKSIDKKQQYISDISTFLEKKFGNEFTKFMNDRESIRLKKEQEQDIQKQQLYEKEQKQLIKEQNDRELAKEKRRHEIIEKIKKYKEKKANELEQFKKAFELHEQQNKNQVEPKKPGIKKQASKKITIKEKLKNKFNF